VSTQYVERFAHVAPLGVRLVDVFSGRTVVDGVSVRVIPPPPARTSTAFRTPSGVFAANDLPGLRRWELREVGTDGLQEEVEIEPIPYRLEVRDGPGHFHPFSVDADLPADGLLAALCGSPPSSPPADEARSLPLFSTPGRPVPPGTAVVRATLVYEADRTPASFAALEVVPRPGSAPVRGIADERGEVIVMFHYPPPAGLVGSPPGTTRQPLTRTTWTVGLQVFAPQIASPPENELPDLCTFLDQTPATLLTTTSPPAELGEATLEYGRELVLRSSPDDPELLLRP
jgi:hypothetical protein